MKNSQPAVQLVICAIYDEKTQAHFGVHESPTIGHAIRQFGDHVKNSNSPLNRHPGDYKLYKLADIDSVSGVITPCVLPVYLSSALDFVQRPNIIQEQSDSGSGLHEYQHTSK